VEWDDAAGAQAHLFAEGGDFASAHRDAIGEFAGLFGLAGGGEEVHLLPIVAVALEQQADGAEVVGDALGDLLLGVGLGGADAHGSVEGEFALVDLLEDVAGHRDGVVGFEDAAAEDHARGLDLLGEADLLVAGEEGDRAHLGEVHADGIVDAFGGALGGEDHLGGLGLGVASGEGDGGGGGVGGLGAALFGGAVDAGAELALVHHLDGLEVEVEEHLVDAIGVNELVGERGVELFVAEPTPAFTEFDQGCHGRLEVNNHFWNLRFMRSCWWVGVSRSVATRGEGSD